MVQKQTVRAQRRQQKTIPDLDPTISVTAAPPAYPSRSASSTLLKLGCRELSVRLGSVKVSSGISTGRALFRRHKHMASLNRCLHRGLTQRYAKTRMNKTMHADNTSKPAQYFLMKFRSGTGAGGSTSETSALAGTLLAKRRKART